MNQQYESIPIITDFNDIDNADYVTDPIQELSMSKNILVKKLDKIFCDRTNRYLVFSPSSNGQMKLLFKCEEIKDMCACCHSNSNEVYIAIRHISSPKNTNDNDTPPFVEVKQPYIFNCCKMPEIFVSFTSNNQLIGKIILDSKCCDRRFSIIDDTQNKKYTIKLSHECKCKCKCEKESIFNIYKTENLDFPIGSISYNTKALGKDENYQITFPDDASPNDKINLISFSLLIYYLYFEGDNQSGT